MCCCRRSCSRCQAGWVMVQSFGHRCRASCNRCSQTRLSHGEIRCPPKPSERSRVPMPRLIAEVVTALPLRPGGAGLRFRPLFAGAVAQLMHLRPARTTIGSNDPETHLLAEDAQWEAIYEQREISSSNWRERALREIAAGRDPAPVRRERRRHGMKSHTTRGFREAFRALPPDVRQRARRAYRLWRATPDLPGLRFKRVWRGRLHSGWTRLSRPWE